MKKIFIVACLLSLSICADQAFTIKAQDIYAIVDWDDNSANMPTQIYLYKKNVQVEKEISTAEFAIHADTIGHSGAKYADFYLGYEESHNSLRRFGDDPSGQHNYFREDVIQGYNANPEAFMGPSMPVVQIMLSKPESAKNVFFLTARRHRRVTFMEGLHYFKEIEIFKELPPLDNIWAVAGPDFHDQYIRVFGESPPEASSQDPSEAKGAVLFNLASRANSKPFTSPKFKVISPNGSGTGFFHLMGFSDDMDKNFTSGRGAFSKGMQQGLWKKLKTTVFFTGTNHHELVPHAEVVKPDGTPRLMLSGEDTEWIRIFEKRYGPIDPKLLAPVVKKPTFSRRSLEQLLKKCTKKK